MSVAFQELDADDHRIAVACHGCSDTDIPVTIWGPRDYGYGLEDFASELAHKHDQGHDGRYEVVVYEYKPFDSKI